MLARPCVFTCHHGESSCLGQPIVPLSISHSAPSQEWRLFDMHWLLSHSPARCGSRPAIYFMKYSVPDCGIHKNFHNLNEIWKLMTLPLQGNGVKAFDERFRSTLMILVCVFSRIESRARLCGHRHGEEGRVGKRALLISVFRHFANHILISTQLFFFFWTWKGEGQIKM